MYEDRNGQLQELGARMNRNGQFCLCLRKWVALEIGRTEGSQGMKVNRASSRGQSANRKSQFQGIV